MNQVALGNPEAIINAAVAANAAAQSAYSAFIISMILLGAVVLMTLISATVAIKFHEMAKNFYMLEKNTNSIKDALIVATRKLALIEGTSIGKAEAERTQAAEEA